MVIQPMVIQPMVFRSIVTGSAAGAFVDLCQQDLLFLGQHVGLKEVRAHFTGEEKGLLQAPFSYFFVVAGTQNIRYGLAFIYGRLGVLGIFQESVLKQRVRRR